MHDAGVEAADDVVRGRTLVRGADDAGAARADHHVVAHDDPAGLIVVDADHTRFTGHARHAVVLDHAKAVGVGVDGIDAAAGAGQDAAHGVVDDIHALAGVDPDRRRVLAASAGIDHHVAADGAGPSVDGDAIGRVAVERVVLDDMPAAAGGADAVIEAADVAVGHFEVEPFVCRDAPGPRHHPTTLAPDIEAVAIDGDVVRGHFDRFPAGDGSVHVPA